MTKQMIERIESLIFSKKETIKKLEAMAEASEDEHAAWEDKAGSFEPEEVDGVETEFDVPEPDVLDFTDDIERYNDAIRLLEEAISHLDEIQHEELAP